MEDGLYLPKCRCGEVAILRTAWTEANPGRRFFGCCRFENGVGGCDFFKWYDSPTPVRVKMGLLRKGKTTCGNCEKKMKEQKSSKLFWIQLIVIFVIGIAVGRRSY